MAVNLAIESEGALFVQLKSSVKGSHTHPYQQNIRIVWRPDYSAAQIKGDCSCAEGYNCKHVAAACLIYQNSNQTLSLDLQVFNSCFPESPLNRALERQMLLSTAYA